MSQHDMDVANGSGASVRADINLALKALASTSKGNSTPATPYAGQLWIDDNTPSGTMWTLFCYDGTDSIAVGYIDSTNNVFIPAGIGAGAANVASASTTDLGSTPETSITVTGTTTIESFGTSMKAGQAKIVTFSGALTLTHNGTSLILPGGANITTAAGDQAIVHCLSSGNYRVMYLKANGQAVSSAASYATNFIINPTFSIAQYLPASNADDTYAHDCWYVLTQTNTIAVTQLTDIEDGNPYMARLTQSQASAQRMGYATILESRDCKHLRGQTVNLSMRYRCSSSQAIRFAILEWTGTADSVTSDVVNDWTSGTYTAGNFFLGSNLTVRSVSAATPSAATLTDFTVSVALGSSFNNLIIFMWTEGTAAQNVTLDFGKVKLERGSSATTFVQPEFTDELNRCRRFWYQTFEYGTVPAQNAGKLGCVTSTSVGGGGNMQIPTRFPVNMRTSPTITTYNPSASNANVRDFSGGTDVTVSVDPDTCKSADQVSVGGIVSGGNRFGVHFTADSRL